MGIPIVIIYKIWINSHLLKIIILILIITITITIKITLSMAQYLNIKIFTSLISTININSYVKNNLYLIRTTTIRTINCNKLTRRISSCSRINKISTTISISITIKITIKISISIIINYSKTKIKESITITTTKDYWAKTTINLCLIMKIIIRNVTRPTIINNNKRRLTKSET